RVIAKAADGAVKTNIVDFYLGLDGRGCQQHRLIECFPATGGSGDKQSQPKALSLLRKLWVRGKVGQGFFRDRADSALNLTTVGGNNDTQKT
ncbi:MAG: hypothetical protein HOJ16_07995, partial [Candidatus Peribacter sp.]|nr:hypothetical protein [Candidatus Peribacter sp.]